MTKKKNIYWVLATILACCTTTMSISCGDNSAKKASAESEAAADTVVLAQKRDTFPADRWMMENKLKEGVIERDSIQYKVIKEGTGKTPTRRSRVKMNFDLRLTNGKVVESHMGKDVMELPVSRVIPGLQNALRLMPVGSTWEIYIPWELGYGAEGSKNIPPHSALIFKVHLLEIVM